jgi:hypothetical protein
VGGAELSAANNFVAVFPQAAIVNAVARSRKFFFALDLNMQVPVKMLKKRDGWWPSLAEIFFD